MANSAITWQPSELPTNDALDNPMAASDAKRYERLVDAVSRAQFEPVMKEGNPVAVNMVWFVANTTVRGHGRKHIRDVNSAIARKHVA